MRLLSPGCAAFFLALCSFGSAEAGTITPSSYTYGAAALPQSPYDDNGTIPKLTDGDLGTLSPTDGTWVGWPTTSETITFNFAVSVAISDVLVDFLRNDDANITVPATVVIDSTSFSTTNFIGPSAKGVIDFSGSWTGTQVTLTLTNASDVWNFVNEVQFTAAAPTGAPEPGTVGLALGAMAALIVWQRKRKSAGV